jgi:hypothetical protein
MSDDKPMTVGDVIKKLQEVDPNLPVLLGAPYTIDLSYLKIEVEICELKSWETSNHFPDIDDVEICVFNPTRGPNGELSSYRLKKEIV